MTVGTHIIESIMTTNELYERARSWIWAHDHIPFPASDDPPVKELIESISRMWDMEVLIDIAEWELPVELTGTPVEIDLTTAIDFARKGDKSMVNEIHNRLLKVMKYMADHKLYFINVGNN